MIAACPTRGWPDGLTGRRDGFLIVCTEVLGLSHHATRLLSPADIGFPAAAGGETVAWVEKRPVPAGEDPRTCPACAVVRWLDILGLVDGLGRGSARMTLTAVDAVTSVSPHQHTPIAPQRWRGAAVVLPAIDQHGWHADYRPITTRAIRARLARAAAHAGDGLADKPPPTTDPAVPTTAAGTARSTRDLQEALTMLDAVAQDADALNARILALLADA